MPIVIGDLSGIGQGIQTGMAGLASGLEKRAETRLADKRRSSLESVLKDADLETPEGQQKFLKDTTAAGIPQDQSLGILDRVIKQQGVAKQGFQTDDPEQLASLFERLGIDKEQSRDYADLYGNLSQGGKTSFANMFIDNMQRRQQGKPEQPMEALDIEVEAFQFPEVDMFQGLTPKEKVGREKDLFNTNSKDYAEIAKKSKSLKNEGMRVQLLERYNNSGKLPEGMDKLNIDWKNGDIRFPALANPETQGFVKTINDFTVKAKETFGARVTNFELQSFMRRLPTLANSTEGRRLIISQMRGMEALEQLEIDSLKEVYDNYGLRGIDSQQSEQIAAELRAPQEAKLREDVLNSVDAQEVYEAKEKVPAEKVVARDPNGKIGYLPVSEIERAQEKGYQIL